MSKNVIVACEATRFWAFDLALGIWLKKGLDIVAMWRPGGEPNPDEHELRDWECTAVLGGESTLDLTPRAATQARRTRFAEIAAGVAEWLRKRPRVPGPELASWRLLDNSPISRADVVDFATRGFATAPVLELGEAIVAAVEGRLPHAPEGARLRFGHDHESPY